MAEAEEVEQESQESVNPLLQNPSMRWYVVNTYSGSEETVRLALRERIAKSGLGEVFGEIFVPKMVVEKFLKGGKKKLIDKTNFPGYVMVQMDISDEAMACVTGTPKVTGFVGNRRKPRPMSDSDVLRLLTPTKSGLEEEAQVAVVSFKKGEAVKVIDGPFTNFDGVVEENLPEKSMLRILVSIFGREKPIDLAYRQVRKLD